jgi:hypothetical protein
VGVSEGESKNVGVIFIPDVSTAAIIEHVIAGKPSPFILVLVITVNVIRSNTHCFVIV